MADEDLTKISTSDMQAALAKHTQAPAPKPVKKAATPKTAPVVAKPGVKDAGETLSKEEALQARIAALEAKLEQALSLNVAGAPDADIDGRHSVQNQGTFGVAQAVTDLGNGTKLVNY